MVVIKTRGNAKRLNSTGLGHRTVRFKAKDNKRSFSVHENLICSKSKLFKKQLQARRKPIEGECAVCHENLNPQTGDVTFCRGACGQNIHEECIEMWARTRATCPQCQEPWRSNSDEPIVLDEALNNDAVQLYLDWLYTDRLLIPKAMHFRLEMFMLYMLRAWTVSDVMQDDDFRHALIAEISKANCIKFKTASIKYAFEQHSSPTMQAFILDVVLTTISPSELPLQLTSYPPAFAKAACDMLLKSFKEKSSYTELLKKHTDGNYEVSKHPFLDSDYDTEQSDDST